MFVLKSIVLLSVVALSFAKLELTGKMHQIFGACTEKFDTVTPMKDILDKKIDDVEVDEKCFIRCLFQRGGIITEAGFQRDAYETTLRAYSADEAAIKATGDFCLKNYGDLAECNTAFVIQKCSYMKLLELDPTAFHP